MVPVLFHVGGVPVGTHDFFVLLGVLAACAVFFAEARRRRVANLQLVWVALGSVVMGGVFARASTAWRYLAAAPEPSLAGLWLQGGRSILGGLAGAYLGAVLTKRLVGYRAKTGDLFAPAVALGMAVGRWGCFLTEQIGTPTRLPWGISVSPEIAAQIPNCPHCETGAAMHPSFLYEIAFHAVMFGALLWLRPRVRTPGELLKIYLLAYALFRFAVEFVRGNPAMWAGLSASQLFLLGTIPLLVMYFWRGRPTPGYRPALASQDAP
ncbi:MAG TPA: prolipoprotein diacylglyceryl transferase family protein [Egibacteraceae bacterium]|nr:prolipoprotein diacylglyceryl transferase family protein [Egibacteraceae bacterium]